MIRLMIGLLIIACIAPLFIKGPDGEPIMTLDDWKFDVPDSVAGLFGGDSPVALPGTETVTAPDLPVYKWQDEEGQWHFSNTPPAGGAEEVEIGDVNLMEAYVPPAEPEQAPAGQVASMPSPSPVVSGRQVKEMMETVNNLQETLDQRKAEMDELANP